MRLYAANLTNPLNKSINGSISAVSHNNGLANARFSHNGVKDMVLSVTIFHRALWGQGYYRSIIFSHILFRGIPQCPKDLVRPNLRKLCTDGA